MSHKQPGLHGVWRGRWTFILAATGSAVGLGNIWKFPYITGENGGGAFVLMYLLCILIAGVPVMMAETMLGRKGRMSPIHTMQKLATDNHAPRWFAGIGWMGAVAGFLILSFYSVIAGWTLAYIGKMATGAFVAADAVLAESTFTALLASPWTLMGLHTLFMLMTGAIIALGVHKGLENAVRFLMPALFVMLIMLFGYALTTPGFGEGWRFMFSFDVSKLSANSVVVALGHAFFTLSLGMGAIMAYGAYMPQKASLSKTVMSVAVLDTLVALIAGLIIFPIVFSHGLEPAAGPGLMFQTLPIAFGSLPGGSLIGTVFFILVMVAAWTSAISIAEPAVAWAIERGIHRVKATLAVCGLAWLLGIGTVLSFNVLSDQQLFVQVKTLNAEGDVQQREHYWFADVTALEAGLPELADGEQREVSGKTLFGLFDFVTANIMMPLGGVLIALFVGWFMSVRAVASEARIRSGRWFAIWRFMLRYVSPAAIFYVFVHGLL